MTFKAIILAIAVATSALLPSFSTLAGELTEISELTFLDHQYMERQRSSLDDLARSRLGEQFNGNKTHDLTLLQSLLDRKLVRPDQKLELQAMGVIMGELLAEELDLHWVIYEDKVGRSRALRYKTTDNYLFSMTMISSWREAGNMTPVADIYQRAVKLIKPRLPTPPFQ